LRICHVLLCTCSTLSQDMMLDLVFFYSNYFCGGTILFEKIAKPPKEARILASS
jgi:hypothetical protein